MSSWDRGIRSVQNVDEESQDFINEWLQSYYTISLPDTRFPKRFPHLTPGGGCTGSGVQYWTVLHQEPHTGWTDRNSGPRVSLNRTIK
jgi:hypothetical protein